MDTLFGTAGRVEAVFGRGWISGWEAARLAKGGVVLSETEAGDTADLVFEDSWLGRGAIYVVGDRPGTPLFALRVYSLEREAREAPEPSRGTSLAELLPFEIRLGQADYGLGELASVSEGSIVSLDAPVDEAFPAELRIAGRTAAKGRAVVAGDRMGVLLEEVIPPGELQAEPLVTGSYLPPDAPKATRDKVKIYDFRKPDRFTRRAIRALQNVHERAGETFSQLSPRLAELYVECVDQMTWGEFVDSLPAGLRIVRTGFERPGRGYEREVPATRPPRPLVQPLAASHPLSRDLASMIDRWTAREESFLGDRAIVLAAGGGLREIPPADLLAGLRAGWRPVSDCIFAPPLECAKPPIMAFAADGATLEGDEKGLYRDEMVALVSFRSPSGELHVVYAARALEDYLPALNRHERFSYPR